MTTLDDLERVERELRNPATVFLDADVAPRVCRAWAETIAAFVREQRKREWQPIETAPKCDCCPPVDAWVKSCLLGRFDGHGWITWVGQMDSGMWLEGNSRRSYGDSEMPTHWMPLPAPPNPKAKGFKEPTS